MPTAPRYEGLSYTPVATDPLKGDNMVYPPPVASVPKCVAPPTFAMAGGVAA